MSGERCAAKRCRALLTFETDNLGRLIARCVLCERRRAGVCADCPAPVEGRVGWAKRCARCKVRARHDDNRRSDTANRDARRAAERRRVARWKKEDPDRYEAYRANKNARRREWVRLNPDKRKAARRRYHLKRTPGYVRGYQRNNRRRDRIADKRRRAIVKYYELHPIRPDCLCAGCGCKIAWNGTGRPRVKCDSCCTPAELKRRIKRGLRDEKERHSAAA